MHTENFVFDDSSDGHAVEQVGEGAPELNGIAERREGGREGGRVSSLSSPFKRSSGLARRC
jgi:hypothetical protein